MKIAAPLLIPNRNTVMRKNIWFPSPTAAIALSPTMPIMTVSTKETDETRKFWSMMGTERRSNLLRNCFLVSSSVVNGADFMTVLYHVFPVSASVHLELVQTGWRQVLTSLHDREPLSRELCSPVYGSAAGPAAGAALSLSVHGSEQSSSQVLDRDR